MPDPETDAEVGPTPENRLANPNSRRPHLKSVLSHAGLLLALTAYTAAGGLVFQSLEGPAEAIRLNHLQNGVLEQRKLLLATILNASKARDPNLEDVFLSQLHGYEMTVQEAAAGGVEVPALTASPPSATPSRWTLLQGIFFASTVLTTIGYGNLAPVTLGGRVFCLVFALVGIPLTLTVIADLGVLLASGVSALPCWGSCRSWWRWRFKSSKVSSSTARGLCRSALLALGGVLLLFLYLGAGASLFTLWEDGWDFFDGFYFCFITMTTIGFGDLVPRKPAYMLLCTLYILVGLAITSTIIELVRRQYASSWRRLQEALADSGPAFGDALRRLGSVPDVDVKRLLAAASLARITPGGRGRSVQASSDQEWQDALDAMLKDMRKKEMEREKELEKQREKEREKEKKKKLAKLNKPPPHLIEIIIYETTV